MSHDKIKAAARARMASTGEPYATARRQVIAEIRAAAVTIAVTYAVGATRAWRRLANQRDARRPVL